MYLQFFNDVDLNFVLAAIKVLLFIGIAKKNLSHRYIAYHCKYSTKQHYAK